MPSCAILAVCCGPCRYVDAGLLWSTQDKAAAQRHVACVEDTHCLRSALPGLGLMAFVGNGSVLPRQASSLLPQSSLSTWTSAMTDVPAPLQVACLRWQG